MHTGTVQVFYDEVGVCVPPSLLIIVIKLDLYTQSNDAYVDCTLRFGL